MSGMVISLGINVGGAKPFWMNAFLLHQSLSNLDNQVFANYTLTKYFLASAVIEEKIL